MITGPAAQRLTRTFQGRIATIGGKAARLTSAAWGGLSAYDEADVATFAARTASTLAAAKAAAVQAGVGYYATLVQFRPPAVNVRDVPVTADPREPFIAYWNALKGGNSFESALESGSARAEAVARNLATSASRQAGDVALRESGQQVDGWERVPDSGACDWCLLVAGQVYNTAESADFGHDRCGCSASPLIAVATVTA